jgi:hypothetical protein
VPDEEGAVVSSPNEKTEEVGLLDRGTNGDGFVLSANLIGTLPNAKVLGRALSNTAGSYR